MSAMGNLSGLDTVTAAGLAAPPVGNVSSGFASGAVPAGGAVGQGAPVLASAQSPVFQALAPAVSAVSPPSTTTTTTATERRRAARLTGNRRRLPVLGEGVGQVLLGV